MRTRRRYDSFTSTVVSTSVSGALLRRRACAIWRNSRVERREQLVDRLAGLPGGRPPARARSRASNLPDVGRRLLNDRRQIGAIAIPTTMSGECWPVSADFRQAIGAMSREIRTEWPVSRRDPVLMGEPLQTCSSLMQGGPGDALPLNSREPHMNANHPPIPIRYAPSCVSDGWPSVYRWLLAALAVVLAYEVACPAAQGVAPSAIAAPYAMPATPEKTAVSTGMPATVTGDPSVPEHRVHAERLGCARARCPFVLTRSHQPKTGSSTMFFDTVSELLQHKRGERRTRCRRHRWSPMPFAS